jgi:hypothetical protein
MPHAQASREWPDSDPPPEVPTLEELELADNLRHALESRYLGRPAPELPTFDELEIADELRYEEEFRHLDRATAGGGEGLADWQLTTDA